MTPRYIDAHCHLQFAQYDADREMIVAQMLEQGVGAIVVGCDLASSRVAVELAQKHEHLYAAVGVHPNELPNIGHDMSNIRELAHQSKVVAIGECGLDYFRPTIVDDTTKEGQKELFKQHIALAAELDLPLIIHARPSKGSMDAYHDIITMLAEAKQAHQNLRGDMHFFAGGVPEAEAFIALGFTLSFTAVITFARDYDEVIRTVPLTSMLAETDAPYVAPASRRGQRNDPLAVIDVATKIAEVRGDDPEAVRATLLATTRRVFALS